MPNELLEELAARVHYLAMMIAPQMAVQGVAYQPTAPAPTDIWDIIDPSKKITTREQLTAPPYTEFTNQLQIINIVLLFVNAVIADIFKPPPSPGQRLSGATDKSVFSVNYIKTKSATYIDTLVSKVNADIQAKTPIALSQMDESIKDSIKAVYESNIQQYTDYTKAVLDTVIDRSKNNITSAVITSDQCTKRRRAIMKLGSSYSPTFKLKKCTIMLEQQSSTPTFIVQSNIEDDNTIRGESTATTASIQINPMQPVNPTYYPPGVTPAYPQQQVQQPQYQQGYTQQPQFTPQPGYAQPPQPVQQYPQPGYAQPPQPVLPYPQPQGYAQPPLAPPLQPSYAPSAPPMMPSSSTPQQITPEQGHAVVNQAAQAARDTLGHIPGAKGIIDKIQQQAHGAIDTQPPQDNAPAKNPTKAARRRAAKEAAELKGIQDAKKTVAEAHEHITPKPTHTAQAEALATEHKKEEETKRAELKANKKTQQEEHDKAKEELNKKHAAELEKASTEQEKKTIEEQQKAARKQLKTEQKKATDDAAAAREHAKLELAKKQADERKASKAAQKENMSEEEKAKRAELKEQKKKLQDDHAKEKAALAEQHKKEDEAKRAELKQKKHEEKAAHEREKEELKIKHAADLAKATGEKEKEKLKKEHEAAEKKQKEEHDKAAKAAKDARAKAKKEIEEKQKAERKAQKAAQDKAAKDAKAARKAQKAAVPKKIATKPRTSRKTKK